MAGRVGARVSVTAWAALVGVGCVKASGERVCACLFPYSVAQGVPFRFIPIGFG